MIRIRRVDGKTLEIPDAGFVEICDLEGNVAKVTYADDQGQMHEITSSDPEATQYRQLFPDVKFVELVSL